MLSFITLSHRPELADSLRLSLQSSLGSSVMWELIVIDGAKHDLFTGYNEGASRAKGDELCFVHHDVQFLGNLLSFRTSFDLLKNPSTGFIGIAGAVRLDADGTLWSNPTPEERFLLSDCRGMALVPGDNPFGVKGLCWPTVGAIFGPTLVVDGVILLCTRRLFDSLNGFDSNTFKGFHFYDIDISLRAHLANKPNYIAPIPLYHGSTGNYDQDWDAARQVFLKKHGHLLPLRLT